MANIRNILFDLGNVLFDLDIQGTTQRLLGFLHPDIPARKAMQVLTQQVRAYETGSIDTNAFVEGILAHARSEVRDTDIINAWNSMLVGMPLYRLSMLETLKQNYTVLLLSNINALHFDYFYNYMAEVHRSADFERRYFHDVYYSHLIGYRKPQREAFQVVIENSFITPAHTLFIDDMPTNIKAAKQLGFKTRLLKPEEEIAEVLKLKGYY